MKKRRDFDKEFDDDIKIINALSLDEINQFIYEKKVILSKINSWINEPNISDGRKRFLKGWRKKETNVVSYSKKKINKIKKDIQNISIDSSKKFIETSARILPQDIFQKIYITSTINKEKEK